MRLYLSLVSLFVTIIMSSFASDEGVNLIKNSGFENPPDSNAWEQNNWAKNEVSFELDMKNPHAGKYCQKIAMTKIMKTASLQFVQKVPVKPGMGLELRFWMRGHPNSLPIEIAIRKKNAPYTLFFKGNVEPSDDWREYAFTVVLPLNADPNDIGLFFELKEENTFWLDDVCLLPAPEKDPAPPLKGNQIFNGSFEVGIDKWCVGAWPGSYNDADVEEKFSQTVIASVPFADAPHGKRVLCVPVVNGYTVTLDSGYFPLRYGYPVTVSFWVNSPSPGKSISARVLYGMSKNVSVAGGKSFVSSKGGWERYQFEFVPVLSSTKTYHFRIGFNDSGSYYIDSVTIGEGDVTCGPNPVNVGYESSSPRPANVYYRGEAVSFTVNVETASPALSCTLYGRVIDVWDTPIHKFTLEVPIVQSRGHAQITVPSDKFGGFKCELYTEKNSNIMPAVEIIYSVVPKLKSPKESTDPFFGAHANLTTYNLKLVELMGVRSLRLHPPLVTKWKFISQWGCQTNGIARAVDMGFRILGNFDTVPPELADAPADVPNEKHKTWFVNYGPKDPEQWKTYVKDTYKSFSQYINEWEVWNEPDGNFLLVKPGQEKQRVYTDIVRHTREALDEIHADVKLVGGAVSGLYADFLEKLLEYEMNKNVDAASFHFYYDNASPDEKPFLTAVERVKKYQVLTGRNGKPLNVWHTEGGALLYEGPSWLRALRTPTGASLLTVRDLANTLARTVIALKAIGVERHYHYSDHMLSAGHYINQINCKSTQDYNGMATPAFTAHATCVRFLEDAKGTALDEIRIGKAKAVVAHFTKDAKMIDVVWSRLPIKIADVPGINPEKRKAYDMMGNEVSITKETVLTPDPIYLIE